MYSKRDNKEYTSLKYNIEKVNKEIRVLEQKKKTLTNKRKKFVECEICRKHFRKDIQYLDVNREELKYKSTIDTNKGMLFYKWICPYCGSKQETHYELDRHKRYWKDNDW